MWMKRSDYGRLLLLSVEMTFEWPSKMAEWAIRIFKGKKNTAFSPLPTISYCHATVTLFATGDH